MKKTWTQYSKPPGKRWRYSVADPEDGLEMFFFTARLEAAEFARKAEGSSGRRYIFRDRSNPSPDTPRGISPPEVRSCPTAPRSGR